MENYISCRYLHIHRCQQCFILHNVFVLQDDKRPRTLSYPDQSMYSTPRLCATTTRFPRSPAVIRPVEMMSLPLRLYNTNRQSGPYPLATMTQTTPSCHALKVNTKAKRQPTISHQAPLRVYIRLGAASEG